MHTFVAYAAYACACIGPCAHTTQHIGCIMHSIHCTAHTYTDNQRGPQMHLIAWHHTRVHCSAVHTVQYGKIDWVTECIEMMHYLGSLKAIWSFLIGSYTAWGNYWELLLLILFGKASFCLNPRSFSKSLRFVALFWVLKISCLASTLQHIMYWQVSVDFPFEK